MPLGDVADLPDEVKETLPQGAQKIFQGALEGAMLSGKTEDEAITIAWAAVERLYVKGTDGLYRKIGTTQPNQNMEGVQIFSRANKQAGKEYSNSTLHMLNRWVPDESGIYFSAEVFERSIKSWEGVPLVFGQAHPDLALFESDPERALKDIKGRIVGSVTNPRVIREGHPHLKSALLVSDEEVEELYLKGELSLSTAFWGNTQDGALVGDIIPNHVLLFQEVDGVHMPKDRAALVAKTGVGMKDEQKNAGRAISRENETELRTLAERIWDLLEKMAIKKGEKEPEPKPEEPEIEPEEKVAATEPAPDVSADWGVPVNQANMGPKDEMRTLNVHITPKEKGEDMTNEIAKLTQMLSDSNAALEKSKTEMARSTEALVQKDTEFSQVKGTIETLNAEIASKTEALGERDAEIVSKDELITAQTSELTELKQQMETIQAELQAATEALTEFRQKEMDSKFEMFLSSVKPGLYAKDEDKAELKRMFVESPQDLLFKRELFVTAKSDETQTEGDAFVQSQSGNAPAKSIGDWDPYQQKYV